MSTSLWSVTVIEQAWWTEVYHTLTRFILPTSLTAVSLIAEQLSISATLQIQWKWTLLPWGIMKPDDELDGGIRGIFPEGEPSKGCLGIFPEPAAICWCGFAGIGIGCELVHGRLTGIPWTESHILLIAKTPCTEWHSTLWKNCVFVALSQIMLTKAILMKYARYS